MPNDRPMRALPVVDPNAGMRHASEDDLERARALLAASMRLESVECLESGPRAEECARRAIDERYDAVVVAGGDGTVQAVPREVLGKDTALGILPFGRFMNIAKGLGIPMDAVEAARVIAAGHVRRADVGEVNGHVFFETAGIGLDAQVCGAAAGGGHGSASRGGRRTARTASASAARATR